MPRQDAVTALLGALAVAVGCNVGCSSNGDKSASSSSSNPSSGSSASSGAGGASTGSGSSTGTSTSSGTGGTAATACTVAHAGTSGVVLQGVVLTPTAATQGEVFVSGAIIACAGASCSSTTGYASATILDCGTSVISPGLINAHDHTEYATTGPIPHGTTRWEHRNGWRTGAGGEPKLPMEPASTTDVATIAAQELRFVMGGATSVIGSGAASGLLRNLATYPSTAALEGLTGPAVFFDTFPLGDSNGTELTSGCAYPSPRSASSAFAGGAAYAPHIAEGINLAAENEFTCESGSLGLVTAQTAIIHGVGLDATDIQKIVTADAKLIWSPRSNVSLYGNTAQVTVMKALGVTMALGTDWLASGSMNMLRELQCADELNKQWLGAPFTDQDLWLMATKNAAIAAKFDSEIGTLAPGMAADVAVFSGSTGSYGDVVSAGVEDVRLVMRGGKVLYGDADVVAAAGGTSCAALEVCGISKSVCVDTPSVTLADIQATASSIYPLYFCKGTTPTNEPSCVPYRDTYPNGETSSDPDGDGLTASSDDCPAVFNPIRPMDGTTQADVDGDGYGDACDADPLDPTKH